MLIEKYTQEYSKLANAFTCGNSVIDNFLQNGNALDCNQGITYVMLSENKDFIIGYYNIEVGRVDMIEEAGAIQYYTLMGGSVNINYLAIHSDYQGTRVAKFNNKNIYLGDILLRDCEQRIVKLRNQVGISFITVSSTEDGYHLYHERNSYANFESDMNIVVQESDLSCYKLYKCIDDIIS